MSDLDSFFAKKDKKKVKGRKYDNPDEIAKRLEESEEKLKKEFTRNEPPKKQLDESSTTASVNVSVSEPSQEKKLQQEEEEWKEYHEETDGDMTDLKITKLQIEDDDDAGGGYGSGEDGEGGGGGSSRSEGVWNRNVERIPSEETEEVAPLKEEQRPSGSSSYVPPHLRNVSSAQSQQQKSSRKPKTAPDITSAMAFPSLSDAKNTNLAGPWGRKKLGDDKGFENVKHGSTKTFTDEYAPSKLSTSNRFDALSDNS